MLNKSFRKRLLLPGLLLALAAAGASAQFNPDFTRRIPLTITNNEATATPNPTSVEVTLGNLAGIRADRADLRVVYNNSGTLSEIDSQIFREPAIYLNQNLNAGASTYASLPAGTKLTFTNNNNSQDDSYTSVTLPFNFPFRNGTSNQMLVHIDGFVSPGQTTDPGRPDSLAKAGTDFTIMPWQSDFAITDSSTMGVYYSADATRAVVRWEVQESASGPVIAKFALVLTPDGNIRFAYGDTVLSPSAGIAGPDGYSPIKFGVGAGDPVLSKVNAPTHPADFSNHADILYTQNIGATEAARVVFRLQQPLNAGATSSGQYYIYFGNPSPELNAHRNFRNVFDYTVDFLDDTIGQPAPDWEVAEQPDQITFTVEEVNGVKQGVLRRGGVTHPRAIVKEGAMPKFLNAEILANMTPGGGENEMFPMLRTVQSPVNNYPDPNRAYAGGYGYVSDGFGSQQGLVSVINPSIDRGPADFAGLVPGPNVTGQPYLTLFRGEGQLLSGKRWAEGSEEPMWTKYRVDRTAFNPVHAGEPDPIYDQPGGTGIGSYSSNFIAVEYISLRELRNLGVVQGAAETLTSPGPFLQGTVTSTNAGLNPMDDVTLVITGPGVNRTIVTGPNGEFKTTVPAGNYTIKASATFHTDVTVNAAASASGVTNIVLPYVGATISGTLRDGLTNAAAANAKVTITDAQGLYVNTTTADATGAYSVMVPTGGTYHVNWYTPTGIGSTIGVPRQVTVASGGTATFNSGGQFVGNGDAEMPIPGNTYPDGWTNNEFGQPAPDAYEYVHAVGANAALNHTPGGHWSLAVRNPNGINAWLPPPSAFFDLPVQTDAFGTTVSFWVYFTQNGQEARMRLRNNLDPSSINVIAGQAPPATNENTGGLENGLVPINKWYEIRHSFPAGTVTDPVGTIEMQLYTNGSNTADQGTIYLDDLTITRTPVASALGRVLDAGGNPVAGVRVGRVTKGDTPAFPSDVANPTFLEGPFSLTDENGNFTFYATSLDPVTLGAWAPPTVTNNVPEEGGYLLATATLTPEANPTQRTTLTLNRGTNVADGATATSVPDTDDENETVDNNFATRWASPGDGTPATAVRMTWDLGSAQALSQLEFYWELARGDDYDLRVGNDPNPDSEANTLVARATDIRDRGWPAYNFSPFTEGPVHVFKLPNGTNARYIHFIGFGYSGTLGNYSLIEMRALNNVAPIEPIGNADVRRALQIAGGIATATPADITRLDADGDGRITIEDATILRRSF